MPSEFEAGDWSWAEYGSFLLFELLSTLPWVSICGGLNLGDSICFFSASWWSTLTLEDRCCLGETLTFFYSSADSHLATLIPSIELGLPTSGLRPPLEPSSETYFNAFWSICFLMDSSFESISSRSFCLSNADGSSHVFDSMIVIFFYSFDFDFSNFTSSMIFLAAFSFPSVLTDELFDKSGRFYSSLISKSERSSINWAFDTNLCTSSSIVP